MLIFHSRPSDIVWTVVGLGATQVGPSSNLIDGRPDTLSAFTWLTGLQNTASVLKLRGDWTSGAIVPRLAGLSNLSLPVGTKMQVAFRRVGDGVGTYPYAGTQLNAAQRVFQGARGERTAWIVLAAAATPVIGVEIQIYNDVNGVASIVAAAPFTIGEAVMAAGDEIDIDEDWTLETIDPTTTNYSWNRQPYAVPGCPYRQLSMKLLADDDVKYLGDAAAPTATDYEQLFAKCDRGKSAIYIPRYTDDTGAFSPQFLHRTAVMGIATKLPRATHKSGPIFDSAAITVVESPIPT
jgi:hypothetical protein